MRKRTKRNLLKGNKLPKKDWVKGKSKFALRRKRGEEFIKLLAKKKEEKVTKDK